MLTKKATLSKNLLIIDEPKESFPLQEISAEKIHEIRRSNVPTVLIKYGNKFYYTKASMSFVTVDFEGPHLCGHCKRLSPAPDCCGGCAKVRDLAPEYYLDQSREEAVENSKRVEKYPFIDVALETLNVLKKDEVFHVTKCKNFVPMEVKEATRSPIKSSQTTIALAKFVWPDVETVTEVKERLKRNGIFDF